jgi:hypothetical protein
VHYIGRQRPDGSFEVVPAGQPFAADKPAAPATTPVADGLDAERRELLAESVRRSKAIGRLSAQLTIAEQIEAARTEGDTEKVEHLQVAFKAMGVQSEAQGKTAVARDASASPERKCVTRADLRAGRVSLDDVLAGKVTVSD